MSRGFQENTWRKHLWFIVADVEHSTLTTPQTAPTVEHRLLDRQQRADPTVAMNTEITPMTDTTLTVDMAAASDYSLQAYS